MQVLVVNPPEQALPEGTADLIRSIGWGITSATSYGTAVDAVGNGSIDAVIMTAPDPAVGEGGQNAEFNTLLQVLDARRMAGVVMTDDPRPNVPRDQSLIDTVDRQVSLAELRGRLTVIERYHGLVKRLERELNNMQRLGKRLNDHFREVDQEMLLAARLQRDFLPDVTNPIENVQFATIYRPASWVSGDMFDVFRVDEDRTGFYIADVVGHGMAASLLTMFIKRAIMPKRVDDSDVTILTPSDTMKALNDMLVDQSLADCQFVTACYGLLNHRTLTLQYARGGHPYPILITAEGSVSDLKSPGGLLGVFEDEEFPTFEIQLHPGDKLLLYTDGVELALSKNNPKSAEIMPLHPVLQPIATRPIQVIMTHIESLLDDEAGSLDLRDDVTIVGLEILNY